MLIPSEPQYHFELKTLDEQQISSSHKIEARDLHELLKFSEITELDEVVTHRLIEKIIVEEPQIVDGEKIQKVRIVYNFVGAVTE